MEWSITTDCKSVGRVPTQVRILPPPQMIKKVGSKYLVVAESGRHMGEYKTKTEAKRRLAQIEFFKHLKSGSGLKLKLKKKSLLKR